MAYWSDEEIKMLHDGIAKGASARELSLLLKTKTRNAVIGYMFRNNLKTSGAIQLNKIKVAKKHKEERHITPSEPKRFYGRVKFEGIFMSAKDHEVPTAGAAPKTIMELSMFDCRAVVSEIKGIETLYCGQQSHDLSSWCKEHKMKYFVPNSKPVVRKNVTQENHSRYGGNF